MKSLSTIRETLTTPNNNVRAMPLTGITRTPLSCLLRFCVEINYFHFSLMQSYPKAAAYTSPFLRIVEQTRHTRD